MRDKDDFKKSINDMRYIEGLRLTNGLSGLIRCIFYMCLLTPVISLSVNFYKYDITVLLSQTVIVI